MSRVHKVSTLVHQARRCSARSAVMATISVGSARRSGRRDHGPPVWPPARSFLRIYFPQSRCRDCQNCDAGHVPACLRSAFSGPARSGFGSRPESNSVHGLLPNISFVEPTRHQSPAHFRVNLAVETHDVGSSVPQAHSQTATEASDDRVLSIIHVGQAPVSKRVPAGPRPERARAAD